YTYVHTCGVTLGLNHRHRNSSKRALNPAAYGQQQPLRSDPHPIFRLTIAPIFPHFPFWYIHTW
ncbi:hypothetical protein Csa_023591, partial [Cucumis sativus]